MSGPRHRERPLRSDSAADTGRRGRVRREFRGQHRATALKLLAIRMTRQHGMARMRTNNDSESGPMLAINRKLGYVPEPGEYWLIQGPA